MYTTTDLANLLDMEGTLPLTEGWQIVIRAENTDRTPERPHGLDYAIILQNEHGSRQLGFDNSHAYDNSPDDAPWDHEHKPGRIGQRFRYDFRSASNLLTDFFERAERHCVSRGVPFEFPE